MNQDMCWRCLKKYSPSGSLLQKDKFKIIDCKPHDCEGLEIKIRVPSNICDSCSYALKLKLEFECRVFRTKQRIKREEDFYK
jgi:hypothetical protein